MTALIPVDALAEALAVSRADIDSALEVLAGRLGGVGMCLHRLDNTVAIRPAGKAASDRLKTMVRRRMARSGMNITEARALARALAGTLDEGKLGNANRVALGRLRNGGIISDDGVTAAEDVAVTLSTA